MTYTWLPNIALPCSLLSEVVVLPEDTQLREAVLESISILPDGRLKDELNSNFNAHFRKLKRLLIDG